MCLSPASKLWRTGRTGPPPSPSLLGAKEEEVVAAEVGIVPVAVGGHPSLVPSREGGDDGHHLSSPTF